MDLFEAMIALFAIFLCIVALIFVRFVYKVVWIPFHVTNVMRAQGIEGPPYKFIHGNTEEVMSIKIQTMKYPMELSHDIFPRVQPHFDTWMKLYGNNFLTWAGPQPHMVITEPELAKEILRNQEGNYPKMKIRGIPKKMFGDGLVIAEGAKWSKVRKVATHAFYAENLKDMIPAMITSVETMLEKWRDYEGKEIDVFREFVVLGSEVISRTAFGSSYLEGKNTFEMLTRLGYIVMKSADKFRLPGIEKIFKNEYDIESDKIEQSLRDSILSIIKKREEKVKTGEADSFGNDFLGSLLKVHHDFDKKNKISVDDVIDECKVFYIAGHETTSSLLSWTSLLLSIHTDWQEKAREEVIELFGKENPTSEGLAKMKTVTMIINEALRLYSPAASLVRRVKSKVRLGNYKLPANMELHIPQLALHRNTEMWGEDAHLFKPERFAEGVAKATKNNPMAFLLFGSGPRTCVGLNFATNEAKIALSMILQRYKFTISPNYVHSPLLIITLRPQHGVQVMLEPVGV